MLTPNIFWSRVPFFPVFKEPAKVGDEARVWYGLRKQGPDHWSEHFGLETVYVW